MSNSQMCIIEHGMLRRQQYATDTDINTAAASVTSFQGMYSSLHNRVEWKNFFSKLKKV